MKLIVIILVANRVISSCCAGLLAEGADIDVPVDVYAVGFEEMVDLNASNIMKVRYIYI